VATGVDFFGSRMTWMRGDVPLDATVRSALVGTDSSVRDFPPSNMVPTTVS
jgi:hypothetical protein